jgi:hypothetical protein
VTIAALGAAGQARGQSVEPRLYANTPAGVNFLLAGYVYSTGGVVLDASVPLEDASVTVHAPFVAYVRSLDVAGLSGKAQILVPYGWLSGEAILATTGEMRTRDVDGFGDPSLRFAVNLHGGPALPPSEFRAWRQDLIVGASLQVTVPLGQYDPDRLANLGTNRWSFKPEVGISQRLGRFTIEGALAASLYTDNDDFFGGQHREQAPIYSAQGHIIYDFPQGFWLALDGTYYTGGRTTVDGVEGDDLQRNWRVGLTVAVPLNRRHSIKLYGTDGVSTRFGEDFRLTGAAWQYRWGRGLP